MSEILPAGGDGYTSIHGDIVALLEAARRAAARSVNALMTASYWEIGRRIVEFDQGGQERAIRGQQLLQRLSTDLQQRFGLANLLAVTQTDTQRALFPTQKNPKRGFTANTLCQLFHKIYKDARMTGATSHSGRRTFITKLADKGVGVRVLMALAGHKSIATTQRYIELNPTVMKAAVELI